MSRRAPWCWTMFTKLDVRPPVPPCDGLVSVKTGKRPGCKFKKSAICGKGERARGNEGNESERLSVPCRPEGNPLRPASAARSAREADVVSGCAGVVVGVVPSTHV